MFGYVKPPLERLAEEEQERFRQTYCGLCHVLGEDYGLAARFILNYDFTFLAILLSDASAPREEESRCLVSPLKKRGYRQRDKALELAADESVILAYWQLRDGVADHGAVKAAKYRITAAALHPAYKKARQRRPDFDRSVRRQLEALRQIERENCESIDRPADVFAELLSCAADEMEDVVHRRVLRQMQIGRAHV